MALVNMLTHIYKNKYLYPTPDAEHRGILLIKKLHSISPDFSINLFSKGSKITINALKLLSFDLGLQSDGLIIIAAVHLYN